MFPKPAKACEGALRRGETRVKGSRAIHSPDDELVEEDEVVRDIGKDNVAECEERRLSTTVSPGLKARAANRELFNSANAGSNVHNSHLSKVALVSPCDDELEVSISLSEAATNVVPALDLP